MIINRKTNCRYSNSLSKKGMTFAVMPFFISSKSQNPFTVTALRVSLVGAEGERVVAPFISL